MQAGMMIHQGMMGERKTSLAPTPGEVVAMLVAAYFLWFLADGTKGILAGIIGVGAGIALSRLVGLAGPRRRNLGPAVWALVVIGFVVAAPFLASGGFRTSQMAIAGYSVILVLSLNLLTGYTGQASIGHSAFLGIGGYMVAIMVNEWNANMIVPAVVIAVLVSLLAGLLIGIPALRLSGPYLAIATLGLGVVFPAILKLNEIAGWTGGRDGLRLFKFTFGPPGDWGWLTVERWYYFLTMLGLGLVLLLTYNLLSSPVGRAFRAVRDNEVAAAAMGINIAQTKLVAFAISAAYAGFAGLFFFLLSNRFVSPESFTVIISIELLLMIAIGGMASILGSIIGGFFLVYIYRVGLETFANQTEKGGFPIDILKLDKLKLPFTESGSDVWLLLVGTAIALAVVFGSPWVTRQTRKYAPLLGVPPLGGVVLSLLKSGIAVGLGIGFAGLLRIATDDDYLGLLDLEAMRGVITGAILILIVLALPGGFVQLVAMLQMVTWPHIYAWVRDRLLVLPVEGAPEAVEVAAPKLPSMGAPQAGLLARALNPFWRGQGKEPPKQGKK